MISFTKPKHTFGSVVADLIAGLADGTITVGSESLSATAATEKITAIQGGSYWRTPLGFAVHALVGTTIFAMIAGPLVLLEFCVHKFKALGVDTVIVVGLRASVFAIFAADLFLYLVFLWRTLRRGTAAITDTKLDELDSWSRTAKSAREAFHSYFSHG